jgi:hypothetical protein
LAPLGVFTFLMFASACEQPAPVKEGKTKDTNGTVQPTFKVNPAANPPSITANISNVKFDWKNRQQLFNLSLTNTGEKTETVHAIVYATNEETKPPRRAVSPPTAFAWFELAKSKDGKLKPANIEQSWRIEAFLGARGKRLPKSWEVKIDPDDTKVELADHDLEEVSKHPQWKGKKLGQVGYTEYQLWLFTTDGVCFQEEIYTVSPKGVIVKKESPKPKVEPKPEPVVKETPPEPKKIEPPPMETKPADPVAEKQAANELRLATYFLEQNRRQDAKDKLNLILKKYPDTDAAKKAQKMLKDIS